MTKPINEKPEVQYFSGAAKSINFLDRNASASIEAKRVQSFKSFVVTIDLHMHSNASDGILPPAEVVRLCAGNGVKLMSLTDHDTMKGIEEARAEAERLGIAFVPGIEISTRWGQKSIHVAAYNLNPNTEAFKAFFKGVDKKRIERGERMGKLLAACGCKGAFEGAMALAVHPGSLSRTHFAQWLLDAGYVDNYTQAFDKYLKPGKPGYVQIEWPEIRDAVRFVKSEGGTASLAHPGRYNLKEGWMIYGRRRPFREPAERRLKWPRVRRPAMMMCSLRPRRSSTGSSRARGQTGIRLARPVRPRAVSRRCRQI